MAATKKAAAPKYPTPARRGAKMSLAIAGNPLVSVPFRMAPVVPSGTGRLSAHTYCAAHDSRVKSGPSICLEHGETCDETYTGYDAGELDDALDGVVVQIDRTELGVKDSTLELQAMVDPASVDPLYLEKAYELWPEAGAEAAFDQLAAAMRVSGKWAVGTMVARQATVATVLRWSEAAGCLVTHQCTYDARISWDDLQQIQTAHGMRPVADEVAQAAASMLAQVLPGEFDFGDVVDEYAAELEAAVEAEATGKERPIREAEPEPTPVGDLMSALTMSVQAQTKKAPAKKPAKAAA